MSVEDLASAIAEASVPVVVVRFLSPPVVKGRVQGAPEEKRMQRCVSLQPATSKELQLLPEGMRNQGAVTIFDASGEDYVTADVAGGRLPDRIEYRGVTYQAQMSDDWRGLGGYVRVVAVRVGQ